MIPFKEAHCSFGLTVWKNPHICVWTGSEISFTTTTSFKCCSRRGVLLGRSHCASLSCKACSRNYLGTLFRRAMNQRMKVKWKMSELSRYLSLLLSIFMPHMRQLLNSVSAFTETWVTAVCILNSQSWTQNVKALNMKEVDLDWYQLLGLGLKS